MSVELSVVEQRYQAVLGSPVDDSEGWRIGDTFAPARGWWMNVSSR
jgi:hypothetical protein